MSAENKSDMVGNDNNSSDNKEDTKTKVFVSENLLGSSEDLHLHVGEDLAAQYIKEGVHLDVDAEKRLRKKADMYICSFMCVVYCIQYMDKTATTAGSVMGLIEDLEMRGKMFSWVGSSFYLGYLVFELPMGFLLQRFPLAKTTAIIIVCWGVVMACGGAAQNYAGFVTTRTLLGALEGAITPSFIVLTSQWYKKNEQFTRTLFWFGSNGVGTILGAAIGYALYTSRSLAISGWRVLFIVLGLITVLLGVVFYIHMPDNPSKAWFLNAQERALQVERIRINKQGYGNKKIKWHQVKEAARDPRTYIYFAFPFALNVPNGGITNFQTILLRDMGYSPARSLLLSMTGGGVEIIGCSLTGIAAMYVWNRFRTGWALYGAALNCMCLCLLAWSPTKEGKMAGLFMWNYFSPLSYIGMISTISSNTAGRTKKTVASSMLLIGYCVGNLVGPQTFKPIEAKSGYQTAKVAMASCSVIALVLQAVLLALNYTANKRRDQANEKLPAAMVNTEFADLTDFENPEFRYEL